MSDKPSQGHVNGGEQQSGPIAGTALMSGATFVNKPLHYADVDGMAVFEGDIVLGRIADLQAADLEPLGAGPHTLSIGITGAQFRWPGAIVPFEIDPAMPDQQRVTDAIAHWQAHTSLRFVQRTPAQADFVRFQGGSGCSSQVGRRGGQQFVTLGAGCSAGNAIHEIGHTIGLWHEQSRQDRDAFVTVVFANIDPALQFNFTQHITDGDDLGAYDFGSIMHYPTNAFSKNGQATIVPKVAVPPGVIIGQRTALSAGDLAGVLILYPRIVNTLKEPLKDPVRDTLKELRKDPIQETVKEVGKDPTADTLKEIRKDPIQETVKEVGKDPTADTLKEIRKDPVHETIKEIAAEKTLTEQGFQPNPQIGQAASLMPFVMAGGSQFGGGGAMAPAFDAATQVHMLADALVAAEQHMAELMVAYKDAVRTLPGGVPPQ